MCEGQNEGYETMWGKIMSMNYCVRLGNNGDEEVCMLMRKEV